MSQSVTRHKKEAFFDEKTGKNRNTDSELLTRTRGIARMRPREAKLEAKMTPITATLHSPTIIRLDFRYDPATVTSVKSLRGAAFVADGKFWTVPIRTLDALVQTFGASLQIHPDVLDAKIASDMARVRVFVDNLLAAGISLDVVNGRVTGSGGAYCLDPWQREIDARAEAIVSLGLQHSQAPGKVAVPAPMLEYEPVTAEVMRQAEILVSGFHNAAANQCAEEAMAGKRKRYAKVRQKGD